MSTTAIVDGVERAGTVPFKDLEIYFSCQTCGRVVKRTERTGRIPEKCFDCKGEMEELTSDVVAQKKELMEYLGKTEHTKPHKDEVLRRYLAVFQKQKNPQYRLLEDIIKKELEKPASPYD